MSILSFQKSKGYRSKSKRGLKVEIDIRYILGSMCLFT